MTRYRVNNAQVPHLWAHQSQSHANGSGNIRFDGAVIYSYWLSIGRIVENESGVKAAIVLNSYPSHTTRRHISMVRSAVHNVLPSFTCYLGRLPFEGFLGPDGGEQWRAACQRMLQSYLETTQELLAKAKRMRIANRPWGYERAKEVNDMAQAFAAWAGLGAVAALPAELTAAIEAATSELKARREAAIAEKRERQKEAREDWLNGGKSHYQTGRGEPVELRVLEDGRHGENGLPGMLQTSMGAEVPLADAIKVFRAAAQCRKASHKWDTFESPVMIGHYTLDHIAPNGDIRAGCHLIPWSESERIARQLGLLD